MEKTFLILLLFGYLNRDASGSVSSSSDDASYNQRYNILRKVQTASLLADESNEDAFSHMESLHNLTNLFSSPSLSKLMYQVDNIKSVIRGHNASDQNISEPCFNNTLQFLDGVFRKKYWALKLLDVAGKPASGLLEGNLYWFGSYDECWTIHASNPNDSSVDFNGRYCKMGIGDPHVKLCSFGTNQVLTVTYGVCLPNTCSGVDAQILFNTLIGVVTGSHHLPVQNRTIQVLSSECKVQPGDLEWTGQAIAALSVFGLIASFVIIGTIYDVLYQHTNIFKVQREPCVDKNNHIVNQEDGSTVENGETISTPVDEHESKVVGKYIKLNDATPPKPGMFHNIVVAFSAYTNGRKLLSTAQGEGSLRAVHGIRFISMSWVILGHTFFFLLTSKTVGNLLPYYQLMMSRWTTQAILNATVSVDTFFVLSGTLLAYLFLKEMDKMGGPKKVNWFMFYFHRYWRLTPPYMLVMLMYVPLYRYWSEGPQYSQATYGIDKNCETKWWTNILYINNLYDTNEQCMGWSWYLANDMQFFIISPIILLALHFHWIAGGVLISALVLMNFIVTGVIVTQHHAQATFTGMIGVADQIYWRPWCRVGPYAVALGLGYILYLTKCKVNMKWFVNLVGWCFASIIGLLVVYGLYDDYNGTVAPQVLASLYQATARTAWGLVVCWVIFACVTDYGGFVNTFLSWKGFIPLSRLTYCAYLVHPVVMDVYYMSYRSAYIASDTMLIYSFFGHMVAAYLIAFGTSLLFESPMIGLERALFRK